MSVNCGCNEQPGNCGCSEKLDLLCTFYGGELLMPLNIENGTDGNTVIKIINDYIQDILTDIELQATVLENVGTGSIIYDGLSDAGAHRIKTMLQGSGIKITEQANTITISIDPQWIADNTVIANVGTGAKVWKDKTGGTNNLRTLKGTDRLDVSEDADEVTFDINQDWIDENLVTGAENIKTDSSAIGLYNDLVNTILRFKSLVSSDIIISEDGNDIRLSLPGGGTTSSFFYLDPNFIRPSTWGDPILNPKIEVLNTDIYPTVRKIPTGKLNDPFIDYTEFLLFAVGNEADSNSYGTFTTANPKITGGTLQILSSISTSQRIEVNNWAVYLNNATINFTGPASDTYALDMRRLWSAENFDIVTGKIKRSINFLLGGEGNFTRSSGLGLLYSKGDETKTTSTIGYNFTFDPIGSGLNIIEPSNPFPDTNPNVRLTRADGTTLLSNGNSPVFGRVQAPTTPLIVIDGSTFGYWGTLVRGTKIFIIAATQPHIKFINGGKLSSSGGQIMYQVGNSIIGYETKMIEDAVGNTPDENAFLANRKDPVSFPDEKGFFYKPFEGFNVFDIESGHFRVENLTTEPNGFLHTGANAVVNIGDNAVFDNVVSWADTGGGGALKLIKSTGVPQYINISNLDLVSVTDVLVEGDGVNQVNLVMSNSKINGVRKITENVPVFNLNTEGTLCSIKGNPIIIMNDFPNNSDAITIGKLITGMLYRNTTTGIITQVI